MREAGLGGVEQEFRFGDPKFEMPIRQMQDYAEKAARWASGL